MEHQNELENKEEIAKYIMMTVSNFEGITSEQVSLIKDLYKDDTREFEEIKSELDSYFASIEAVNANIDMRQEATDKTYLLNIDASAKGVRLSPTQMDLITITEISSTNELLNFIANCKQLNYSDIELQKFYKTKLDLAKRMVFEDYRSTLITPQEIKKEPYKYLIKRLQELNIDEDFTEEIIEMCKSGNVEEAINFVTTKLNLDYSTILSKNFQRYSIDYENVKNSSYEEFIELAKKINEFDFITITAGSYTLTVNNGVFDSYHIKRALDFCQKHDIQASYSSLLSQDILALLDSKSNEEMKKILSTYIMNSINFINEYNKENYLTDGMPVINSIVLFDELINNKKDKAAEYGYYNVWERAGLSIEDMIEIFAPAIGNKPAGVEYIYNESYVETKEKRKIQLELAKKIKQLAPELIDIFGTKMHISSEMLASTIEDTFEDLKKFSDETGIELAITEFDIHIPQKNIEKLKESKKSSEQIAEYVSFHKLKQLNMLSLIAKMTGIEFNELSYGSITDSMDLNIRGKDIESLYSGLFGQQLMPKSIKEIVHINQNVERPTNSEKVQSYMDALNSMMDAQTQIVPQEYNKEETTEKKLVKKDTSSPQVNNDDAGYANFPQLLILTLIIVALLYILLM